MGNDGACGNSPQSPQCRATVKYIKLYTSKLSPSKQLAGPLLQKSSQKCHLLILQPKKEKEKKKNTGKKKKYLVNYKLCMDLLYLCNKSCFLVLALMKSVALRSLSKDECNIVNYKINTMVFGGSLGPARSLWIVLIVLLGSRESHRKTNHTKQALSISLFLAAN